MQIEYSEIALIQLDKAIDLHLNATNIGDHICATTLAGAAEEILGKLLPKDMRATKILKDGVAQIKPHIPRSMIDGYDLNQARNAFKHPVNFNKLGIDSLEVTPQKEAELLIRRASANYITLMKDVPKSLMVFLDHYDSEAQKGR
jgi:hypothetical protein